MYEEKMMPGQTPYTEEEKRRRDRLVSDAAEADIPEKKEVQRIFNGKECETMKPEEKAKFQELWERAWHAGREAARKASVQPMVVQQHVDMMDDNSPVAKQWYVPDGVCGFAWIKIKPARGPFVSWLKYMGIGSKDSYAGGWMIWISEYNQSMQRKEAHARAVAEILSKELGIRCWAESRMD